MRIAPLVLVALLGCSRHSSSQGPGDSSGNGDAGLGSSGDPVVSSFVFFGGCRLDNNDLDPTNIPSSANVAELGQTLKDIASLSTPPRYWFFVGDLVDALVTGSSTLQTQLDAWAQLYKASPLSAMTTLVPVTGNHEVLAKVKVGGSKVELSNSAADAVWIAWQHANAFDAHAGNGPTNAAPNADALQDDQSAMTYSFDDGPAHYVVLNTDTWTTTKDSSTSSTQIGWVAMNWLEADLAAAQANPTTTAIYLFGHKPLVAPSGSTASTDAINPALAPTIMQLLESTTKVKGYFTSHSHEWDARQLPGSRGVWQIIAGNGGSPLETSWTEPNPYFGFTVVKTYASGKVGVVSYKRPAPSPYNAPTSIPAQPAAEMMISP